MEFPVDMRRPDITVEAKVLHPKYATLFTDEQRAKAWEHLFGERQVQRQAEVVQTLLLRTPASAMENVEISAAADTVATSAPSTSR